MGITYQIPHTARPIMTTNIFTGTFNNPTPGKYDFGVPANSGILVTEMFTGTVYLIERISVGATIPEGDFLEAIENIPRLKLKRQQTNEIEYKLPLPIVNYIDNKNLVLWSFTEKGRDNLIIDLDGVLNQTAALVGVSQVKINISYTIYAIESTEFYKRFRGELSGQVGMQTMGAMRG